MAPVYATADTAVADAGMNRVGEVDGGGAARQSNELTLGSEAEHLVLEKLELGVLEKLARAFTLGQHLDEMP